MDSTTGQIKEAVATLYPLNFIQIEEIPDEPNLIGVGVYGVEKNQVMVVAESIAKIEDTLFPDGSRGLIPLIRDIETTQQYYPECMPPRPADVMAQLDRLARLWRAVATDSLLQDAGCWSQLAQEECISDYGLMSETLLPAHFSVGATWCLPTRCDSRYGNIASEQSRRLPHKQASPAANEPLALAA